MKALSMLIACALTVTLTEAIPAQDVSAKNAAGERHLIRHYNISAGNAALQLRAFAEQSGLQTMYPFAQMLCLRVREAKGLMNAADALDRMIAGTTIKYEFMNNGTVVLTADRDYCAPGGLVDEWDDVK